MVPGTHASDTDEQFVMFVKHDVEKARKATLAFFWGLSVVGVAFAATGLWHPAACCFGVAVICGVVQCFCRFILVAPTDDILLKRFALTMFVHPSALIAATLFCMSMETVQNHIFVQSFVIYFPPVVFTREVLSLTRESSLGPWCFWIIIHSIMSTFYIIARAPDAWHSLIVLCMLNIILREMALEKLAFLQSCVASAGKSGSDITKVLVSICDAVVVLDSSWRILNSEGLKRFASMLGREVGTVRGRAFEQLVYWKDLERFSVHVNDVMQQSEEKDEASASSRISSSSFSLNLMDAYGGPVAVTMFRVCHTIPNRVPTHIIGICEAWKPKKEKKSSNRMQGTNAHIDQFHLPLGQLPNPEGVAQALRDSPRPRDRRPQLCG